MLGLPNEARAYLADCLVESLDPLDDDDFKKIWATEARRRRDEVRNGVVLRLFRVWTPWHRYENLLQNEV